jgi:hypothetical protein
MSLDNPNPEYLDTAAHDASERLQVNEGSRAGSRRGSYSSQSSHEALERSHSGLQSVRDLGFPAAESEAGRSADDPQKRDESALHTGDDGLSTAEMARVDSLTGVGSTFGSDERTHADVNADVSADSQEQQEPSLALEDIRSSLRDAISDIEGHDGKLPKFLPLDLLRSIISNTVILNLLPDLDADLSSSEMERMYAEIIGSAAPEQAMRRIFAILIWIGKPESIFAFIRNNVRDVHLPLRFDWNKRTRSYDIRKRAGSEEQADDRLILPSLRKRWTSTQVEDFMAKQILVTVPFFDLDDRRASLYHLNIPGLVLPFIQKSSPVPGGTSEVRRVEIHPAHLKYNHQVSLHQAQIIADN